MNDSADQPTPPSPSPAQRIAALESELQRYRQLFEHLPVPVWYHDAQGQPALSNPAMQRMLQLPADQVLSSAEARSQVLASLHVGSNAGPQPQLIHTAEDGSVAYYTLHTHDLTTDGGRALLIYLEDAGLEQSLADMLAARESQLSSVVANIPGMAYQFEMQRDGSITCSYASEGSRLIYGLEPQQIIQSPMLAVEHVYLDDREAFVSSVQAAAAALAPWIWEGRIQRIDGSIIWVHGVSHPMAMPKGGICWNGFMIDITERKVAELAHEASERRLNQFMDAIPLGIYVLDRQGQALYANAAVQEILGRGVMPGAAADTLAEVYQAYLAGTDQLYPAAQMPVVRALGGEQSTVEDMEIRLPGGRTTQLEVSARPITDSAGHIQYALAVFRDITRDKLSARENIQLQQEIIRMQANALAELSTPLIQLDDSTVLMPLIGAIDSQRAQHIIEVLLHGVAESRARVALVDLTGVPVVDTQVASAIIRAAQSVRLLGAEVVLTGIRPEIAQTLVSLGVDLSMMQTRSNLQMGIRFALERNASTLARR